MSEPNMTPYGFWRGLWVRVKFTAGWTGRCHHHWTTYSEHPVAPFMLHTCRRRRWHGGEHRDAHGRTK